MKASLVLTVGLVGILTAAGSSLALIEAIGEQHAFVEQSVDSTSDYAGQMAADVQAKGDAAAALADFMLPVPLPDAGAPVEDVQAKAQSTVELAAFLTSNVASQGNLAVALVAAAVQDAAGSDAAAPARAVLEDLSAQDPPGTFFATGAAALQGAADIAGSNELAQAAALFAGIPSAAQECDYAGSDAFFGNAGLPATWNAMRAWCQGFQDELVDL